VLGDEMGEMGASCDSRMMVFQGPQRRLKYTNTDVPTSEEGRAPLCDCRHPLQLGRELVRAGGRI
jgi:hypothetical protein